jgi:LuxR family maltose regulon positive regulatory protein
VKKSILVVAQEMSLRGKVARLLQSAGYAVELAANEKRALELVADRKIEAAIVAPGSGLVGLAFARELGGRVPKMIVLVERSEDIARLGRSLPGANVCLSQPLDEQQLLDRLAQAMRSPGSDEAVPEPATLCVDGCRVDVAGRTFVHADGREAPLTRTEFSLLAAFARNPGRVLSRDQLSHAIAGHGAEPYGRSIDMHVGRLRSKIESDPKAPRFILTVSGAGYKFAATPEAVESNGKSPPATAFEKQKERFWGPSKIAKPKLAQTADNQRLFRRLDAALERPVVWLHGPPGAGKTTLIATYTAARRLRPLWLRLDEDDGDASTLSFYLGLAEAHARGAADAHRLPALTPDYQRDAPAFSRNLFRLIFGGLEAPLLVLDDYHELGENAAAHEMLAAGFREIPPGASVVVASRAPPPKAFARLRVSGAMEVVAPAELRATPDEAAQIAHSRGMERDDALIELAQGWVAGLVLLTEAAQSGGSILSGDKLSSRELLFDYLSGEVLERMTARERRNLLTLAFMPTMTAAAAERLTGDAGVGELLESLAARNYFTVRDAATEVNYRFHPLFRNFLIANAYVSFDEAELTRVRRAAANALAEAGQPEPAAALLAEASAWDDLAQLILFWAPALESAGRHATITAWIDRLPQDRVEADAWLLCWAGEARLPMMPEAARPILMRALDLFEDDDDVPGAYLAWAGATEAIWQDLSSRQTTLDESIARLRYLNRRFPDLPSVEIECRVATSMYIALSRRSNDREEIAHWRERALAAAAAVGVPGIRYNLLADIVVWALFDGQFSLARELLAVLPTSEAVGADQFARMQVASTLMIAQAHRQAPGSAIDTAADALNLRSQFGLRAWGLWNAGYAARECVRIGDLPQARTWLAHAADLVEQYQPVGEAIRGNFNSAFQVSLGSVVDLAEGKTDSAIAKARAAVEAYADAGLWFSEAAGRLTFAQALILGSDSAGAAEQLGAAESILNRSASESLRFSLELLRAELALRSGDGASARVKLAQALALGRTSGARGSQYLLPSLFSRLCGFALAHDIEPDYVQELIRLGPLPPPEEGWPFVCRPEPPLKDHRSCDRLPTHENSPNRRPSANKKRERASPSCGAIIGARHTGVEIRPSTLVRAPIVECEDQPADVGDEDRSVATVHDEPALRGPW